MPDEWRLVQSKTRGEGTVQNQVCHGTGPPGPSKGQKNAHTPSAKGSWGQPKLYRRKRRCKWGSKHWGGGSNCEHAYPLPRCRHTAIPSNWRRPRPRQWRSTCPALH
eukprot:2563806-Pyramimonas_sp.AAC.1